MSSLYDYFSAATRASGIAIGWMRTLLFQRGMPVKWLRLGLVVWLIVVFKHVKIGTWLMPGNVPFAPSMFNQDPTAIFEQMITWFQANLPLLIGIVAASLFLGIILLWVSSVAQFVFLNDVATNRGDVFRSWRLFMRRGLSLFLWRIGLFLITLVVVAAIIILTSVAIGSAVAYFAHGSSVAIVVFVLGLVAGLVLFMPLLALGFSVVFLRDFVVPFMYKYDLTGFDAWGYFLQLFRLHWAGFLIFALLKLIIILGLRIAALVAIVCTCGIVLWPIMVPGLDVLWIYLLAVALLPLAVFFRALGPAFLFELNPAYQMLGAMESALLDGGEAAAAGWTDGGQMPDSASDTSAYGEDRPVYDSAGGSTGDHR